MYVVVQLRNKLRGVPRKKRKTKKKKKKGKKKMATRHPGGKKQVKRVLFNLRIFRLPFFPLGFFTVMFDRLISKRGATHTLE